jgi:hypothetical protein
MIHYGLNLHFPKPKEISLLYTNLLVIRHFLLKSACSFQPFAFWVVFFLLINKCSLSLSLSLSFCLSFFWDQVLLYSPRWPQTHYVARAALASQVLELLGNHHAWLRLLYVLWIGDLCQIDVWLLCFLVLWLDFHSLRVFFSWIDVLILYVVRFVTYFVVIAFLGPVLETSAYHSIIERLLFFIKKSNYLSFAFMFLIFLEPNFKKHDRKEYFFFTWIFSWLRSSWERPSSNQWAVVLTSS